LKNIPEFQLIYFNLRALAEAPQMMMRYADIKYSYKMAWDFYGRPWSDAKEDVPFNQLPILVIDEKKHIWQSGAIIRYLSKYTNTEPKGRLLKAEVDAVHEQSYELFIPLNPIVNLMVDETHIKYKKKFLDSFPKKLKNFSRQLALTKGSFFFGQEPYYCDFSVYHHFSLAKLIDEKIFDQYHNILNFMSSFESLPGVKNYLKERPKLIDIGKSPKLIKNGIPVPTGTDPNKKI
tara:strand:- start:4573 stop:5274 length:702 start_codon:yes stop_codon:yes gene_type:complete